MGPFYVLSNMGLFYVYQPITLWVFFMYRDPLSIMGLSYVLPRPFYIRKTNNKMTISYMDPFYVSLTLMRGDLLL